MKDVNDYMKSILNKVGVDTLDDLIKSEEFIEYCKKFDGDMMDDFKDKVESYIIYKMKFK